MFLLCLIISLCLILLLFMFDDFMTFWPLLDLLFIIFMSRKLLVRTSGWHDKSCRKWRWQETRNWQFPCQFDKLENGQCLFMASLKVNLFLVFVSGEGQWLCFLKRFMHAAHCLAVQSWHAHLWIFFRNQKAERSHGKDCKTQTEALTKTQIAQR